MYIYNTIYLDSLIFLGLFDEKLRSSKLKAASSASKETSDEGPGPSSSGKLVSSFLFEALWYLSTDL